MPPSPPPPQIMSRKLRLFPTLILTLLLADFPGCSKKPEVGNAMPPAEPSPAHPGSAGTAVGEPAGQAVVPPGVPSTANKPAGGEASAPKPPSSPPEIAQMLKTTDNNEAAYTAIREYASKNPLCFPELSALLRGGDPDLALLGAHGLSALSTPEAATDVLAAIGAAQAGLPKRQLAEALANFKSPELAELFLGLLGTSQEREIVYASQRALANSADTPLLNQVVQRYEASNSATERDNLTAAIREMQNTNCVEGLLSILNQQRVVSSTDPLGLAAVDTLGIIGSPGAVSNLFTHLWSLREGASSPVFDSIGRVSNPESLPLIGSVALGQVPGASLYSRTAAVQALANYSGPQVQSTLNWLVQNDPNGGIREAAANALKRVAGQ